MEQRTFIRHLRNNPTPAESELWQHLSARRTGGTRFNRQVKIDPYIADFAARSAGLVIELDGHSHGHAEQRDAERTRYIEAQGYRVIRFHNNDVMANVEGVVAEIARVLAELPSPDPSRKREGRRSTARFPSSPARG